MSAIAIVGAAARFPGAPDLEAYWRLMIEGRHAITSVPKERWSQERFGHPSRRQPGRSYTFAAGVVEGLDQFDAAFFGISPREAEQIDPQQRWLLDLAWEAIQDAGLRSRELSSSATGVYMGATGSEYGTLRLGDLAAGDGYFMTGTTTSIAANRISYIFDLHGPSFTVDTACSSSLVALDLACQDLRDGRTGVAIAGGVNILLTPYPFIGFSKASMLSPDGRCFAFDARANGYVRSEGAGVVVLKRLEDALHHGDPIRAVIAGSGTNSDGRTLGLSLPNLSAQTALLRAVYAESEVDPASLDFIEAHGTGTPVGDPIELGALGEVLGARRTQSLPVGSAKTNVGHLEVASGMAGLLKAMLSLEHRVVPPSLNFETPNPNIDFAGLNLKVIREARPLDAGVRRAGINSFGFGGSNAHVILESAPVREAAADATPPGRAPPLLISARSQAALAALEETWRSRLSEATPQQSHALILGAARRRDHHGHRLALRDIDGADAAGWSPASPLRSQNTAVTGKLVFVFNGNGSQWAGMGRQAMAANAAFAASLARTDALLQPALGWSLVETLRSEDDPERWARTDVAQPLLFAVQVAIVEALKAQGVEPAALVGHSVGEIAAAWASGALSLEAAAQVVIARSRQQQRTHGQGRMAALALPVAEAEQIAGEIGGGLEVCADNSASSVTLGGPADAIDALRGRAAHEGWRSTVLPLDYAFHTAVLDPVRDDLLAALSEVRSQEASLPFISTVTGEPIDTRELDADYWWRNIRDRVRFREALDHLIADGARIFVEIGPQPVLQSYMREQLRRGEVEGRLLRSLSRAAPGGDPFAQIAAEAYAAGYDLASTSLYDGPCAGTGLPTHPWRREAVWFRPTSEGVYPHAPVSDHPLLGVRADADSRVWSGLVDLEGSPWLRDHAVEGISVVPAAALIDMAIAASHAIWPQASVLEARDLQILAALTVEEGAGRETRFSLEETGRFRLESRPRLADGSWVLNVVGKIATGSGEAARPERLDPVASIPATQVYATAAALSLDYGPLFQVVSTVAVGADGSADVRFVPETQPLEGRLLGIERLDGALQGFLALRLAGSTDVSQGESLLPERFGRVRVFAPYAAEPGSARIRVDGVGQRTVRGAVQLIDDAGRVLVAIDDCMFRRVRLSKPDRPAAQTFRLETVAAPLGLEAPPIDVDALCAAVAPTQDGRLLEVSTLFRAALVAIIHETILGVAGGDRLWIEDLIANDRVAASARTLLAAMLHELAANDLAALEDDGGWRLSAQPLAPSAAIWNTVSAEAPGLGAELAAAAELAARLPGLLRGEGQAHQPLSSVEPVLFGSLAWRAGMAAIEDIAAELAARWPAGRALRVLVVARQAGAPLGAIGRSLAVAGERLRVTTAILGDDDKAAIGGKPDADAGSSVLGDGLYDLVLCAQSLSRAGPGRVARVAACLAPGGVCVLLEPQPNLLWDLLFGADPSWWRASAIADYPLSPLQNGEGWARRLALEGLVDATSVGVHSAPWSLSLIVGRRLPSADVSALAARPLARVLGAAPEALATALHKRLQLAAVDALNAPVASEPSLVFSEPSSGTSDRIAGVIARVQGAVAAGPTAPVWVITRGAEAVCPDVGEAAVWGAVRSLSNELLGADIRLLDLDPTLAPEAASAAIFGELTASDGETQIARSASGRRVLRVREGAPLTAPPVAGRQLIALQPGLLSSLTWEPASPPDLQADGVRIEVAAAALNFRDLMWAQALLPEEALEGGFSGATLGLECAGVVSAVGAAVTHLSVGDRVMAMAPQALASTATTRASAVVPMPSSLSFEEAATLPVAFLTVLYALDHLARLEPGESLLVHGGAGAVGMAAIQVAKQRGAIVFVTAGNPMKRALAARLGADHVLDSRSLSFADEVRTLTGGRGVDVVLNSLSGEAMIESLALLRPFGRFLELGKRDFYADTSVGLRALRNNITYFAVDADRLPVQRPELSAKLLHRVMQLVQAEEITPLPYRVFERSDVLEAFRLMQGGAHIGKLVIVPDRTPAPDLPAPRAWTVDNAGVHVVTGGLGGFGLETARWLVGQGARRLALLGRQGPATLGAEAALAELRAAGAESCAYACDVADAAALGRVLQRVRDEQGPIVGVVHAAAVIEDGLWSALDPATLSRVLAAKLEGAVNLDRLTADDPIALFVLFSSATTVLGAPGQGAYVAGNTGVEALSRRRAALGRPSLAVGWGPIADVGVLKRNEGAREHLARRLSVAPIPAAEALAALPDLWRSGAPVLAHAAVKWEGVRRKLAILSSPTFGDVIQEGQEADDIDLVQRLQGMTPDQAKAAVRDLLIDEMSKILSCARERLDPSRPLPELGMDSLMAVELRMVLESRLKVSLPLLSLSDTTTIASLAGRIVKSVAGQGGDVLEAVSRHESAESPALEPASQLASA